MRDRLLIFAIAFAGGITGANVQPLLTGAGKILFPENATPASIAASSGALTIAAGGTNQNLILTPSGTGLVTSSGQYLGDVGTAPAIPQLVLKANALGALSLLNFSASNQQIQLGFERVGSASVAQSTEAMRMFRNGDAFAIQYATGLTVGNPIAVFSTAAQFDMTTGFWGYGGNAAPGYAVDVTGDVNASGVFRKGGTAGTGGNTLFTVCTSGACITSCTLQFNGGIRVGGTCP